MSQSSSRVPTSEFTTRLIVGPCSSILFMIVVIGVTGQLGSQIVNYLLDRGVPDDRIVAADRDCSGSADFAAAGVEFRRADYDLPETLPAAFAGADKVLLVSSPAGQMPSESSSTRT